MPTATEKIAVSAVIDPRVVLQTRDVALGGDLVVLVLEKMRHQRVGVLSSQHVLETRIQG
jgi:hypothetical protein